MERISHLDTDCHTSDIGHRFAMTVFSIACQKKCRIVLPDPAQQQTFSTMYHTSLSLRASSQTGVAIRFPHNVTLTLTLRPTAHPSHPAVGEGLASPARGNAAIRENLGAMERISHLDTDCHTSDIGHWFAMTAFFDSYRMAVKCSDSGEFWRSGRDFPFGRL